MAALYRKYRPQTFADVVGQEAVVRTLSNAIESGEDPPGLPLRRAARHRQDVARAHPREGGQLRDGPTPTPDNTCHACVVDPNGTSLDVVEMDAASQRGIDDIREIRDRVVLQPVEGRSKVYILDEAHQLTDAAWNALLKLIEEPPPHLVFVFCTTELQKVLPTVRSRCQTFVFQRPRLPDLVRKLRRIADGEGIDVPDAALALVAAAARGDLPRRRLDARPARRGDGRHDHGAGRARSCSERSRRRCCSGCATSVVDRDTAGALLFLEELSARARISAGSSSICSSTCGS